MSLARTLITEVNADYPSGLDAHENRVVETGLLTAVIEMSKSNRSIISPNLKKLAKTSQSQSLKVPVMKKGNVTIKNKRTCQVACKESKSGFVTINWQTVVADICLVPSQYRNNLIQKKYDFNKKIEEMTEAFRLEMEQTVATELDVEKSTVYNSRIIGTKYPLAGDSIQVSSSNSALFFGDLRSINFSDNIKGKIKVIGTPELMPIVEHWANQGAGNARNTAYQFTDKDFRFTNGIENGPGVSATGYFVEDGAIGLLTRTDVDAQMKHKATKGTEWWEQRLNGFPFPVGVKYDSDCSDQSAIANNKLKHLSATLIEHYQFSFDFAVVTPYNSDSAVNPTQVRKFEIV